MKAIIFDFNGTMFSDTEKNRLAWSEFLETLIGRKITDAEFMTYVCGPINDAVLRHFYRADLTKAEVEVLSEKKEQIYRRLCLEDAENLRLMKGLAALLNQLQEKGIPFTIATGSCASNVDFYFAHLGLGKWFDRQRVVYDDGTIPGKPNPEIYLRACEVLGVAPKDCAVVEDSIVGIQAARDAGVGKIVAIATSNPYAVLSNIPEVDLVISDFNEFEI